MLKYKYLKDLLKYKKSFVMKKVNIGNAYLITINNINLHINKSNQIHC